MTSTGMNCTAWNSVRANALHNSPRETPSTATSTAVTSTHATDPALVTPSSQNATAHASPAWSAAATENALP